MEDFLLEGLCGVLVDDREWEGRITSGRVSFMGELDAVGGEVVAMV